MWCKTKTGGTGSAHRFRAGVKKLLENVRDQQAVVLLVCDQPFVTVCTINDLITVREKTHKSIVASTYADTLGVPALFAHCFFQELLSVGDEAGAKSIILRKRERVAQFAFPQGNLDMDTLHDYEELFEGKRKSIRVANRYLAREALPLHYLPPKSRRNDLKKRPGKVVAFWGSP